VYKLPKDFDGQFFIGRILEYVTFSAYAVDFGFDEHVAVQVLSSLQHQSPTESEKSEVQTVPLTHSKLMQITGQSVVQVKGDEDGTLTLFFNNGHIIRIFDDTPHYESYSINDGKRDIYV
jgi:hypothetical protein